MPLRRLLSLSLLCFALSLPALAADHWVGTWASSPLAAANTKNMLAEDTTVRNIVHVSLGGSTVRVAVSNEFGTESLRLGGAQIALRDASGAVQTASSAQLTFHGAPDVVIPAGAMVLSDPAALKLPALSDAVVTMFFPAQKLTTLTLHALGSSTNYTAPGNQLAAAKLENATEVASWYFLKGIDVMAEEGAGAVVTLGDSITDGAHSTKDANARWPDVLARRLQANKKTAKLAVLNEAISGNRLLHDNAGPNALARFDRDVLAQAGVRYLIVLEGINDIGRTTKPRVADDPISAPQLLLAMQQIIDRAHAHGIKVYGATLTPYGGADYGSPAGETMRGMENDFIRSGGKFDGVIDFDKLTRDPANPRMFLAAYDSSDHLHPKDAGYKAMGEGIDLKLFEK